MADQKTSTFGVTTTISGGDYVPILKTGNKIITFTNFVTAVLSGGLSAQLSAGNTTGANTIRFEQATAQRVAIFDSNKDLIHSIITVSELANLSGSSSNLQTQIDGLTSMIAAVSLNTFWKDAAVVATTANITLSGVQTIDGVLLLAGQRVLVKNQTNATENGIYICRSSAWERADDFDAGGKLGGATINVQKGSTQAEMTFKCTNDEPVDLGIDNITWVNAGGTTYVGTSNRVTVSGNTIDIAATYIGQTSITTVGTITSGTWNGSQISASYLELESANRTGLSIQFDKESFYGSVASPETGGAITVNTSGARNGIVQKIIHQAGSEPSYPAEFVTINGSYSTTLVNYIVVERINATKYHVWIYQEP